MNFTAVAGQLLARLMFVLSLKLISFITIIPTKIPSECCSLFVHSFRAVDVDNRYTYWRHKNQLQQRHYKGSCKTKPMSSTTNPGPLFSVIKDISKPNEMIENKKNRERDNKHWFPTRIQETIDYNEAVQRLYVRHIVTATKDMADLVMQQYLSSTSAEADPFASLAKSISACTYTKNDGGTIGWIDRNDGKYPLDQQHDVLSKNVIIQLYSLEPKSGDVHIVHDVSLNKYHVIQVTELWMSSDYIISMKGNEIRSKRKHLKGRGILPQVPINLETYEIQTSGCQMNVADSERLEGILQQDLHLKPFSVSNMKQIDSTNAASPTTVAKKKVDHDQSSTADVIVFNTCSIRDHAEQKLYNALGPYASQKRNGKQTAIIVTGCVAQQEGENLIRRIPEIDAVLGPQYIPYLRDVIERIQEGSNQLVLTAPLFVQQAEQQTTPHSNSISSAERIDTASSLYTKPIRGHDVRAWVNIIHGCNEHCTYCVVPSTRGMEQSRSMESILAECNGLGEEGYREITLLGQNIDAYGRDMVPKRTFAQLLAYLDEHVHESICRIRYVTSHPRYFSDRVIDAVANLQRVCECFHMPFQAGDDTVLSNMRRGYTHESYLKIIDRIRSVATSDAAITTDIIVGFPGETDEQFQRTLELMETVKFDNVNSFIYSPRPNTEAASYDDPIPYSVKAERLQQVQQLATNHAYERSQRYLNRIVEVLVEDVNPKVPNKQVMGRTRQGRQVYFDGAFQDLKSQFVNVRIVEARPWSLVGERID